MYHYEEEKPWLLTPEGQKAFFQCYAEKLVEYDSIRNLS